MTPDRAARPTPASEGAAQQALPSEGAETAPQARAEACDNPEAAGAVAPEVPGLARPDVSGTPRRARPGAQGSRATPEAAFAEAFARLAGDPPPAAIGVAVSGGGDSMALLHLAAAHARAAGIGVEAVTVDHGLRPEAASEAQDVAAACAALGLRHEVLRWTGWSGGGNLQDAARAARRALIADWAARRGLGAVLLGHTADDQAETVLMRLARGSGVDGLAGMPEAVPGRPPFLRPLLGLRRAVLRDWLRARGIGWAEDPGNADLRFDRIKARQMLDALGGLGLTPERLLQTADHMRAAQASLQAAAAAFAARHVTQDRGDLLLDRAALRIEAGDEPRRVLAAALAWVGGAAYRPRYAALAAAADAVREGRRATLGGCLLMPQDGGARITRELAAVAGLRARAEAAATEIAWDRRWRIARGGLPVPQGGEVAALGPEGLPCCPQWRASLLPRATLLASPAVWLGGRLLAAPLAGPVVPPPDAPPPPAPQEGDPAAGWSARIVADSIDTLLSH